MLRSIKLSVDKVFVDPGGTLLHRGTSYQVAPTPDFTIVADLIVDVSDDRVNLLDYRFEYDLQPNEPLYVRTRYHFNTGAVSSWSSTIELSSNQVGFKGSNTVLATPLITTEFDYTNTELGELVVSLSATVMHAGAGTVESTSWTIETTDGNVLYELPKSRDVLNELRVPISKLNGHVVILASAVTHSNTNATSNRAQTIVVMATPRSDYFLATLKGSLCTSSDNYISVVEHAGDYASMDVRIINSLGDVLVTETGLDPYTPWFTAPALGLTEIYTVEVRGQISNGAPTPWVECYRGYAIVRSLRVFDTGVTYETQQMSFGGYIDFNGLSAQSTHADEDNVFYLAVPETNTLAAYRAQNGRMYPIGKVFDMGVNALAKISNTNFLKLPNGKILLDHSTGNAVNLESAAFTLFDYNHISKELTKVSTTPRLDERFGTGRTNSAVVTPDNLVYYVPGEIFDANGVALDLELRVYDANTATIIDHIPLPVNSLKNNVSLCEDKNGDIYMFGGTGIPTDNIVSNEEWSVLLNSRVYKLDKLAKTWTRVGSIATNTSNSYRYRMIPMKNGKFLVLNTTPGTNGLGVNRSYIFNPQTGVTESVIVNNPSREHMGISIELNSGDVGVMSSTADVVESISFIKTTNSDIVTNTLAISNTRRVVDLVVAAGDVVYLRDPYLYASIVIEGTSMANTGRLVYIKGNIAKQYYYNDRIITRDTTITIPAGSTGPDYNNLLIVGNATLNIVQL